MRLQYGLVVDMSIQISPEIEASLVHEARKQGISIDALLELLVSERQMAVHSVNPGPELLAWDLGVIGSLHRRDIYDDVP